MPVFRVRTIFQETYESIIKASDEDAAKNIGHKIACRNGETSTDYIWYDSETKIMPDDTETDNGE